MTPEQIVAKARGERPPAGPLPVLRQRRRDPRQEHACRPAGASDAERDRPGQGHAVVHEPRHARTGCYVRTGRRDPAGPRSGYLRGPAVRAAQRPDARQHGRARPFALGSRSARVPPAHGRKGRRGGTHLRCRLRERVLPRGPDRGRLPAGGPEPVLQRHRDGIDRGGHPGHHRRADRAGSDRRALAP